MKTKRVPSSRFQVSRRREPQDPPEVVIMDAIHGCLPEQVGKPRRFEPCSITLGQFELRQLTNGHVWLNRTDVAEGMPCDRAKLERVLRAFYRREF